MMNAPWLILIVVVLAVGVVSILYIIRAYHREMRGRPSRGFDVIRRDERE